MANGIFKGINLGGPLSMHEENISHPSQVGLWKAFIQTFPHSVSLAELEELLDEFLQDETVDLLGRCLEKNHKNIPTIGCPWK